MKFNYIKFKNFLSYGSEVYEIQLSKPGVTLLTGYNNKDGGSNGSGKSSAIVDSIVYGLFGQTTKGLKADQVVNNKIKKDCFVEISFNINKYNYTIRRYRKHKEFNNSLIFLKDGSVVSGEKSRDTQSLIESTIKISFKSFVRSIVLSQEKMNGFAENEPTERRKIIENLLMYEFISKYQKASKEVLKIVRPEIQTLKNRQFEKKETIDTLGENLLDYVAQWENSELNKEEQIKKLKKKIKDWGLLNLDQELKARESLTKLKAELETLVSTKKSLEESLFSSSSSLKRQKAKLIQKNRELEEVNENPDKCPVCESDIKHGVLKKYIQARINEVQDLNNSIKEEEENIKNLDTKTKLIIEKIDNKSKEILTTKEKITPGIKIEEIENLKSKTTEAKSEIKILKNQIGALIEEDEYVINTQSKIQEVKDEIKKLSKKVNKLEHDYDIYEWWKDALGNSPTSMKSFCVNHILKSLNKYINYYLTFFGYDVSYELNAELEDIIIKDGEDVSFNQLSGGEKRSVEVSLVFALYEIVRLKMPDNINIIVLDEILSNSLDDVRITGALELLTELEGRNLSIFVIDHRNLIKENLDCSVIKVTKNKDGFSSLELG